TPEQVRSYEKSLKYYRDMKNSLDTAFDEGKQEKEWEIVIKGLQQGLETSLIAALTGLSEADIERIKTGLIGKGVSTS
ncbi:MAG: hypothetical protein D3905_08880, partial [Candidatus Electrothrix sp. AS4_5]|nr:hypothetical protein [Candidatus Electrothrix gigas]